MEMGEFLEQLEYENGICLIESGSPQKLRHYTDMVGFFAILKSGYIRQSPYYWGGNGISTVRPSSHILDFNDKKHCGYFEIDFDILNDKIRKIKKQPINELELEYEYKAEKICNSYHIPKHEVYSTIYDFAYESKDEDDFYDKIINLGYSLKKVDSDTLYKYYYNMIKSLYYREGEERIQGNNIRLNIEYLRFYCLDNFKEIFDSLGEKTKTEIKTRILEYPKELFVNMPRL